jgi:hypothetical protein
MKRQAGVVMNPSRFRHAAAAMVGAEALFLETGLTAA